jgi:anti-sigma-K factor RskA
MTRTRGDLIELAAGHAVGALAPDEAAAMEAALPGDAGLRREVDAFRHTLGTVLAAEPPMPPGTHVRAEWLRRVRGDGTSRASATSVRTSGGGRSRMTPVLVTLLAASLILAAALGVGLRKAQDELDGVRSDLATAQAAVENRERQLNTMLDAGNGLLVAILKDPRASQQGVQVYWNVNERKGMLNAFGLAPAPAGREYQLWLIRDGKPVSSRVFNSTADGRALVENLDLPESAAGVTVVAITVEPAGGSPQPTSTPILAGTLLRQ